MCKEKYGTRSKLKCGWCGENVHKWCASVQTKTKFAMCFTCHEEASLNTNIHTNIHIHTYNHPPEGPHGAAVEPGPKDAKIEEMRKRTIRRSRAIAESESKRSQLR